MKTVSTMLKQLARKISTYFSKKVSLWIIRASILRKFWQFLCCNQRHKNYGQISTSQKFLCCCHFMWNYYSSAPSQSTSSHRFCLESKLVSVFSFENQWIIRSPLFIWRPGYFFDLWIDATTNLYSFFKIWHTQAFWTVTKERL